MSAAATNVKRFPEKPAAPESEDAKARSRKSSPLRAVGSLFHQVRERLIEIWLTLQLLVVRIRQRQRLIVLFRDFGIGDLVCTFPVVSELRRSKPDHAIVYVTLPQFRDFIREFSDATVVVGSRYVHYHRPLPRVPAWIATKVLFPRYEGERGHPAPLPRSSYSIEMARSCGVSLETQPRIVRVDPSKRCEKFYSKIASLRRPIIGFHHGPSAPVREWPQQAWQELIERLRADLNASVIRFGSAWHHSFQSGSSAALASDLDLTDQLSLVETTDLISMMDLFIGIDSGLLHIARAVGTPVLGLFGPTDPGIVLGDRDLGVFKSDLPCLFCQHRNLNLHWNTNCPYDIQCMKQLTPEMIFERVAHTLSQDASPGRPRA